MHKQLPPLLAALLVAGCASTPDPPTVNGRDRVQINSQAEQQALALRAFPPAPSTSAVVLRRVETPAAYTMTAGCASGSPKFAEALEHDAEVRRLIVGGLQRVELRGTDDAGKTIPQRQTQRCMESAYWWLAGKGVPQSQIFVNYTPAQAGGHRVDIRFFRR